MQKKIERWIRNAGCLVLTVLLLCGCASKQELVITSESPGTEQAPEATMADASDVAETSAESAVISQEDEKQTKLEPKLIYVQVSGAVCAPGVYELPEGARVYEAIEKAGGMTADAVPESVNQASVLTDGSMVILYRREQWESGLKAGQIPGSAAGPAEPAKADDGLVNINTADEELLCTIPGIGETRAQSIITYRENNGAFQSIEDIMKVSGIKDGLFQKIKDKIKV